MTDMERIRQFWIAVAHWQPWHKRPFPHLESRAEDGDHDEIRRGAIILGRALGTAQPSPESDAHQKAGCFDCDMLWNGETAAADAIEHRRAVGHEVWRIYRPD